MIPIFFLIVGSAMIGIGTGSWWIGGGVAVIAIAFLIYFSMTVQSMYVNLIYNLTQIYQKIG